MKNERLVLDNMGLAHHTAFMFRNCGIEMDDLKSICTLGLCKAALTYEEGKAVKFSIYAVTVMRNEVLTELRKKKRRDLRYGGSLDKEICEGVSWVEVIPDPGTLPDEHAPDTDGLYRSWMRVLKPKERQVVCLIVVDGMTQKEAGRRLGYTTRYINMLYRSAVKKGRERMRRCKG